MEVAPQELAQLLKLAGVGAGPEPDMPEPEIDSEPEVSVMAIPSDDGAPVGGGCGAPEPEHDHPHDHPHDHDDMRSIIDMLQSSGDEPIEESPPKDDYENASKEFTGHPVDVIDSYDQYSYEPAKNSGMQRRTNSYGDNPLREEDLILEYTEFKKNSLSAIREALIDEATWWERKAPTWLGGKSQAELDAEKAAETGPIDGEPGSEQDLRLGPMGKRTFMDKDSEVWKKNMAARPNTKLVPTSVAGGGMKTSDPRARGPETFRGASSPTLQQARAHKFQNVIKPQVKKTTFASPASRRQTTVSSKYGDGMDRLKILAGI